MSASKKCKLVGGAKISDVPVPKPIDWTLCCLCQYVTSERFICPANSKKSEAGTGYNNIGENLTVYQQIGKQPVPVNISLLDEGSGISEILKKIKLAGTTLVD